MPDTLLEKIRTHADACKIAEEARALHNKAPTGSFPREYYYARWVELANAEAPAKAIACKTADEAKALYLAAPGTPSDRIRLLAPGKGEFSSPEPSIASNIFYQRWVELADAEAPARAAACTNFQEAALLFDQAPKRTEASEIYHARSVELLSQK